MRALSIVHQTDAAAGVFADAVVEHGHEHEEWLDLRDRPAALSARGLRRSPRLRRRDARRPGGAARLAP